MKMKMFDRKKRSKLNYVACILENVLCSENDQPESEGGHYEIGDSGLVVRFHLVNGVLIILIIVIFIMLSDP